MKEFESKEVSRVLGVEFRNTEYLQTAFTHRSYINEHRNYPFDHNERLEFLGDAVLELIVTEYLFHHYPNPEGELTSWRAALVNGEMLARVGAEIGIEPFLIMSRGESKDTGRSRQYLIANAMEAIIGALYLDQGYDASKDFILRVIVSHLPEVFEQKLYADPKSDFQEQAQTRLGMTPSYRVLSESGPDHDKCFTAGAYVGDDLVAEGTGNSKQEAQREAAKNALKKKGW
ncbi:MAG: ribonuclease III [Candidatus Moraniibacteriota bacterium]|nr:MAG: ribonuclease III [Candidatus Moranbacteria bacterium]